MPAKTAPHRQRRIQKEVAAADRKRPKKELKGAMQAGARKYPSPPFPKQHQRKPGSEASLKPAPLYDAPFYLGLGPARSLRHFQKVLHNDGVDYLPIVAASAIGCGGISNRRRRNR